MLNKILNPMAKTNMMLDLITSKQQTISENISNMHTPGYQRQDVDFKSYLAGHGDSLETKLSQKLGPSPVMRDAGGEVNAAEELMEMQKTQIYYTVATRHMSSTIQQLKQVSQAGR